MGRRTLLAVAERLLPGAATVRDGRNGRRRTRALAVLVAAAAMAVMAPSAAAAPPVERFHDSFSDTNPTDNLCGIDGSSYDNGMENVQVFGSQLGLPGDTFRDEFRFNYVFTSAATGKSVELFVAQLSTAVVESVNPDGSRTYIVTFKGLPEKIKLPNGSILSRDAGEVIFRDAEDADGHFVSRTLIDENGPHTDLDSGFTIFCDVIVPALS
jgi:hypothetical protein